MAAVVVLAFLDDHHGQATAGQFVGRCGTAGTAAQDHYIRFQCQVFFTVPGGGDLLLPAEGFDLGGQLHRFPATGGLLYLIIQHIGGLEGQGQQAQQFAGHRRGGQFVEKAGLAGRAGSMEGVAPHQSVAVVQPQQAGFQAALQGRVAGQLRIHLAEQGVGICRR